MWWTFQTDCIHPPEWVIIECFPLLHILSRPFVIPFFSFFYLSVCGPFSRTKNKRCREFRSRVSFVFASAVRRWMCVLQGQWCVCKSMPQSSVHFSLLLLLFSLSVIFFFFFNDRIFLVNASPNRAVSTSTVWVSSSLSAPDHRLRTRFDSSRHQLINGGNNCRN